MASVKLSKLIYHLYDTTLYADPDILGLALDHRNVKPGYLFFACKGTQSDGRHFIKDAIKNGAAAILSDVDSTSTPVSYHEQIPILPVDHLSQKIGPIAAHFYNNPSKKISMIGVTGTNGKTSISHFIANALTQLKTSCGVIGTLGSGIYPDIISGSLTTPDAITLQATLAHFFHKKTKAVAMEVSSHSLDQGRVNGIDFEVGIFTNLTRDHLDYHKTMEAYGAAKSKLFEKTKSRYAVINADDHFGKELIETLQRENIYAYSTRKSSISSVPMTSVDHINFDLSGIRAKVFSPWGQGELYTPLIGQFNLSNVLAVLTTLCLLDIPFETSLEALAHLSPVAGRMQTLGGGKSPLVVVDYAHTPDALEKVLVSLRVHCEGKLYCLFGCGGDRDRGKRPLMAQVAERLSDQVMVTDDNPRTEDPAQIVADIMQGFEKSNKIMIQHDRSKAIQEVIQYAKAGDCVLIAGKGAERYQQVGHEQLPFSDIEKVMENLP